MAISIFHPKHVTQHQPASTTPALLCLRHIPTGRIREKAGNRIFSSFALNWPGGAEQGHKHRVESHLIELKEPLLEYLCLGARP